MSCILQVNGLCKGYPGFELSNVSFELGEGVITGFIGRNGAGKTTTLKALFGLVRRDAGEISFFGTGKDGSCPEIKQEVGFVNGTVDYYLRKKTGIITDVTRSFYANWDDAAYKKYMTLFGLDESKAPCQLSAGMRVKYAIALALSHRARLLVLDEPTSGLDPVSREELLEVFLELKSRGTTILFSTHITSDLEKCADDIIYIRQGRIAAKSALDEFKGKYVLTDIAGEIPAKLRQRAAGMRRSRLGHTLLLPKNSADGLNTSPASLDEIIAHLEQGVEIC